MFLLYALYMYYGTMIIIIIIIIALWLHGRPVVLRPVRATPCYKKSD